MSKNVQTPPGQIFPILQYFSTLLDKSSLNKFESIELARPVLEQDRILLLQKWLNEKKLELSEELGDIVFPHDTALALSIHLPASVPLYVLVSLASLTKSCPIAKRLTILQTTFAPSQNCCCTC